MKTKSVIFASAVAVSAVAQAVVYATKPYVDTEDSKRVLTNDVVYLDAVSRAGTAVQSVNGERGTNIVLSAASVNALADDYSVLTNNANFKSAVEKVSPPVVLPEKWALSNVTNAHGAAVSASDFGVNDYLNVSNHAEVAYVGLSATNDYRRITDKVAWADVTGAPSFATEYWVTSKGYATESWVTGKGYATESWVTGLGYATEGWVLGKKYVTESITNTLVSETWVTNKEYVTKSVTNSLASESWVTGRGYATTSWVEDKKYVTESVTNGLSEQVRSSPRLARTHWNTLVSSTWPFVKVPAYLKCPVV